MDISHLKSLIDQAIGDYSQLGQSQKYKDTKAAFAQKGNEVLNTVDESFNPVSKDGTPNLSMGIAGHLKYKTDLAEGLTKLKDKDIKELIRMILPFDRSKTPTGHTQYINPLDKSEHYVLDFSDPAHAIIKNAYSGESKGNGTLNKKLYAMLANEGFLNHNADKLTQPDKISIMNIVEPNTKLGILNGKTDASGNILPEELFNTLWGKTPKRLGERFGGEAQPISMGSSDMYSNLNHAIEKGYDPHNIQSMKQYLNFFEPRTVYRPDEVFSGVDFTSKIKYPKK